MCPRELSLGIDENNPIFSRQKYKTNEYKWHTHNTNKPVHRSKSSNYFFSSIGYPFKYKKKEKCLILDKKAPNERKVIFWMFTPEQLALLI